MAALHARDDFGRGRNRSFGGCTTCRTRHMKCDEGRPTCSVCRSLGLECGGYTKSIFFDLDGTSEESTLRFRRPLLTENQRERMSQWLTSTVPPKSTLRYLLQIDEECERTTPSSDFEVQRGPFSAFKIAYGPRAVGSSADLTSEDIVCFEEFDIDVDQVSHNDIISSNPLFPQWTESYAPVEAFAEEHRISPDHGVHTVAMNGASHECLSTLFSVPAMEKSLVTLPDPKATYMSAFGQDICSNPIPLSDSYLSTINDSVPPEVVFLIKHYSTTVLRFMTPFQHSKTPWHILFIPHARSCLAALTLGERLDNASLCSLYGMLALSAFSLGGVSLSEMWTKQARAYHHQARQHAQQMMDTAYNIPKTAKYKSLLIALVTMVQLSMLCGSRDETEYFFLETEKLIRLKGLKRKKSRKVRLLHHCYGFERIFYESTCTPEANTFQRNLVKEAVQSSGLVIYGQDSCSFRVSSKWTDLDEKMSEVKNRELGENDLHLEQPGIFTATLYPEIYGIPETWMMLTSQIIRLGREKDTDEADDGACKISLKAFNQRAKALERRINQLHLERIDLVEDHTTSHEDQGLQNVLDAVQHALSIYFYRQIYDVDASLLQHKVLKVRDCLTKFENADPQQIYGTARFIWPAFIAASEAEDAQLQASFAEWFNNASQRSGLPVFRNTLDSIEGMWCERRGLSGASGTWLGVLG